jgi:hypothetical protein
MALRTAIAPIGRDERLTRVGHHEEFDSAVLLCAGTPV